jgi:hypothetical protein
MRFLLIPLLALLRQGSQFFPSAGLAFALVMLHVGETVGFKVAAASSAHSASQSAGKAKVR